MLTLLIAVACSGSDPAPAGTDSGTSSPADLVSPVPAGQTRAGLLTDAAALFGGVSAEGQVGDYMLKNALVHVVVQGPRDGDYYIAQAGGIIDMDLVRPSGQPGRDFLDEHQVMAGVARVMDGQVFTVMNDGQDGADAVLRVEGPAVPLDLVIGAVESDELLPTGDMWLTTEYTLPADSYLVRIDTDIEWRDDAAIIEPGDVALLSDELAEAWYPVAGFDADLDGDDTMVAAMAADNSLAVGVFPDADAFEPSPLQSVLGGLGPIVVGMYADLALDEGDSAGFGRWLGVGPDIGSMQAAWWDARGVATETFSGQVLDDLGQPVPGARVHLRDSDGGPVSMVVADADGAWTAQAPVGRVSDAIASGRGSGRIYDQAAGAAASGPYADAAANGLARDSLQGGADLPDPEGYGLSDAMSVDPGGQATLTLTRPGLLEITTTDLGPAKVQVSFLDGDPVDTDERLVPSRPSGRMADGFLAQGSLVLPVEAGRYSVLVHRGVRHDYAVSEVELAAGDEDAVEVTLTQAYSHPGVLTGDPHSHASPSNDASATMEERLFATAAHGVQLHYGTDHDHVVDYRMLLAPLALDSVLGSVVADEVSPPLRGHFNVYPLDQVPDEPNGGSVRWFIEWEELGSTQGLFDAIADRMLGSEGGVIAANHPTDSGLGDSSGYDIVTGSIGDGNRWSPDFDAIEVRNSGDYEEYQPLYMDMVARGLNPAPVSVSDAHGADGSIGDNLTFIHLGIDDVSDFTPDLLRTAMAARATVASSGPYLSATVDGQWAPGQDLSGPVDVELAVFAPDWIVVDTVTVWRDGQAVEEIAVSGAAPEQLRTTVTLDPDVDAAYVFVAEGAQSMSPVYGDRPWALTAAIRIDADGDGVWTPPLPSLVVD